MQSSQTKTDDVAGDSREEIKKNLVKLRKTARDVEHRIPMLTFRTDDEILQIKRFLLVYYLPILSKIDIKPLSESIRENNASETKKAPPSNGLKRPRLDEPKGDCTKT